MTSASLPMARLVLTFILLLAPAVCAASLHAGETGVARVFLQYDQDGWHANWQAAEQAHAYTGGLQGNALGSV